MGKQVVTALIGVFGTIVGFYFGTELAQTAAGDQGAPQQVASALVVGDVNIGDELIYLVRRTEDALEGITDEASANAAAAALSEIDDRLQELSGSVDQLPEGARSLLADLLSDRMEGLKAMAYGVSGQERVAEIVRPKLAPIISRLDNWAQTPT
jgi:hypothetical protein